MLCTSNQNKCINRKHTNKDGIAVPWSRVLSWVEIAESLPLPSAKGSSQFTHHHIFHMEFLEI